MTSPIYQHTGYAVERPSGTLATKDGQPAIFHKLRPAGEFRDELTPHVGKCKVIRVSIEIHKLTPSK